MIELKGMTWNHRRGIKPLEAISKTFHQMNPNIKITWDARSLADFEDYPIDKLAETYDLIMIDHPFMGEAAKLSVLEPLNKWLDGIYLENQKENSVGDSFRSYNWNNKQYAIPTDAASQVACYRKDIFNKLEIDKVPETMIEVDELISKLPAGYKIGLTLEPTHAFITYLSIGANIDQKKFYTHKGGFDKDIGIKALKLIKKWSRYASSDSLHSNPIDVLDKMSSSDEIVYIPFIFGYSNYSRNRKDKKTIHFTNIPSSNVFPNGSVLGGVGISLSAKSAHKKEAIDFIKYVTDEKIQCTTYIQYEGQPAHRKAWLQTESDTLTADFFKNTLATIDSAYVRPRYYQYVHFQKYAGKLVHKYVNTEQISALDVINELNELYVKSVRSEVS